MNAKIETLVPVSELARRNGVAHETATSRLELAGIKPDAELLVGTRRSFLFSLERFPLIQRAICTQPEAAI
jgi:hypothetical protein